MWCRKVKLKVILFSKSRGSPHSTDEFSIKWLPPLGSHCFAGDVFFLESIILFEGFETSVSTWF